ncbi:hypothetical protein [Pedomonas mirosovicensis]|jgi:hypothetical protein|uniref:hypothetical protein n=1 Tax=Pedomonas mirosovicensis TaxID=2908641 RepID=UPI002169BDA3|nr:hypothetical protein [Pedomonas mirosovicensis]MCH8683875.1 hypothetical protein [Pedomonas mirosovicensis]
MSEAITFDRSDWRDLTGAEKRALRAFSRVGIDFEPLAKAVGVGQKSMDALIEKGLAVEGKPSLHGRTFKITEKGWLAVEWLSGRRG